MGGCWRFSPGCPPASGAASAGVGGNALGSGFGIAAGGGAAGRGRPDDRLPDRAPVPGGFTLIELLITMAILSMVLAMVYGILVSTLDVRAGLDERTMAPSIIGPRLISLMAQDLQSAAIMADDPDRAYFAGLDAAQGAGGTDRIDFVSTRRVWDPDAKKFSDWNEMGFQLRPRPDASGLFVLYRRVSPGIDEEPLRGGRLEELYDRVVALDIKYVDREAQGEDLLESWDPERRTRKDLLPAAVRIELQLEVPRREGYDDDPDPDAGTFVMYVPLPH